MNNTSPWMRRVIIYSDLLVAAFLLGLIPMWLKYRECSIGYPEAKRQLSRARILNSLASAVIEARRGDYEPARQAASDFYTGLRAEAGAGADSALSYSQREEVQPLFTERDELITLLARGEAASADRLSDLYAAYSRIMSES
jgi:hypothetical protein